MNQAGEDPIDAERGEEEREELPVVVEAVLDIGVDVVIDAIWEG